MRLLPTLALGLAATVAAGCGTERLTTTSIGARPIATTAATVGACRAIVARGVLPSWTRAGFSDARPRLPHTLGVHGRIAALLFGDPLTSPHGPSRDNKILWVAKAPLQGPSGLQIRARRVRNGQFVGRSVLRTVAGGPGPSVIDLPGHGCWRLRLAWNHQHDQLDLRYRAG